MYEYRERQWIFPNFDFLSILAVLCRKSYKFRTYTTDIHKIIHKYEINDYRPAFRTRSYRLTSRTRESKVLSNKIRYFSQHKEEVQAARDKRKDRLLTAVGIKILRLPTTTIECKEKIISVLTDNTDSIILQERTNWITSVSDDIQTIYLHKGLTDEKL